MTCDPDSIKPASVQGSFGATSPYTYLMQSNTLSTHPLHQHPYRRGEDAEIAEGPSRADVVLRCKGLTQTYDGLRNTVDGLTFSIPHGHLFALLGPNGAGKTSTLRLLAGLLEPMAGNATLDGVELCKGDAAARRLVGYLPDNFALYDTLTAQDNLLFFAKLLDIAPARIQLLTDKLLEEFDLGEHAKRRVGDFSRGMKQRLGLAKTLLHDPKLILLDEPASALDPNARAKLKASLARLKKRGKTIIVSSHILPDLAGLADSVGIIECGKLVYAGPLDERAIVASSEVVHHTLEVLVPERADLVFSDFGPRLLASEEVTPGHFDITLQGGPD
ncbi:MAG: ABC transporter ATP-binding protein, partial [Deltaproteobacteria bacterium]|nr:ABC transporter ATP-binding protein [Deltaproteobacteria bacterium]